MTAPWQDDRVMTGLTRQLMLRRRILADGAHSIGWKIGFGAPASLELMELTAPLVGFLTDATVHESGDTVDTYGWEKGMIEFELAVYMGDDLGPGATPAKASAAIRAVGAAIELADVDLPVGPEHVEDIVAGGIFHEGLILGQPDPARAGLDISGLRARIIIDGEERASTSDIQAITGNYDEVVANAARTLSAAGERLRAGDVIITGSIFPPIPIAEGAEYVFALDPLDPISVILS